MAGMAGRHPETQQPQEHRSDHTLRNVAGGMVAGAVLGHMLSGDRKSEAHENIHNYNTYNEYYGDDDGEYETDDFDSDYSYDNDDDYDDDDSYDSSDYDSYDNDYDWSDDSYDDGGDW